MELKTALGFGVATAALGAALPTGLGYFYNNPRRPARQRRQVRYADYGIRALTGAGLGYEAYAAVRHSATYRAAMGDFVSAMSFGML